MSGIDNKKRESPRWLQKSPRKRCPEALGSTPQLAARQPRPGGPFTNRQNRRRPHRP
ncbi:hypothetical protein [Prochlorococcus marinus]|uniref:hypothetical protein n=1 Tax=Prochlorococcus marinus TaxID=1219 RepID=UPI001F1A3FD5|nr:hypothetical protein [Prochlorococcus marinus]